MAYVVDYATASDATDTNSHTGAVPLHQTNDVLLWFVEKDTNAGGDLSTPAGWTSIVHQSSDTNLRTAAFYIVASSSSTSAPATTSSDTDGFSSIMFTIRDADTSDVIEASATDVQTSTSVSTYNAPSVTTSNADCLICAFCGVDGNALFALNENSGMQFVGTVGNSSTSASGAWFIKKTAGATATPAWQWSANARASLITVAINNASGGKIPAYTSLTSPPTTLLATTDRAVSTTSINGYSYQASLSLGSIGAKSTTYIAGAAATGTGLVAPARSWNINTGASTAYTNLHGQQINFDSSKNLTTGLLGLAFTMQSPKDAYTGIPSVTTGSVLIVVADASNNYRAFEIFGKDSSPEPFGWSTAAVNVNQSTTDWAESGTPSISAVTYITALFDPEGYTGIGAYWAEFHQIGTLIVYGGNTADPLGAEELAALGRGQRLRTIYLSGSSGLLSYTPIQIGGGEPVTFDLSNSSLQFPKSWDTANRKVSFHGNANDLGITYYGVSGDTIKHTNSVVSSGSPFYWSIHASATSAATWDFSGLTIVGATVTLRDVMTFDSMSFVDCVSIDASSCDLTNCTISGLTDNDDLDTDASTTFNTCHFYTDSLAAGEYMCSVADPSIFTDCHFTGTTGTGHAIRITTAGTYTFTGNQFTGYGADASTSAAIYNDSGGLVTINIAGGGDTPTYRNGTSASTVINNATTVKVTCKDLDTLAAIENARVFIQADTGGDLPANESVTITRSSTTATVAHTGHGLANGAQVVIRGALQEEYNGVKTITYIDAGSYSYTVSGTPATPATGTITSSAVIIYGLTDASGIAQNTSFSYTSDQPITGRARKASSGTYYKSTSIVGTITSTGFDTTVLMAEDV